MTRRRHYRQPFLFGGHELAGLAFVDSNGYVKAAPGRFERVTERKKLIDELGKRIPARASVRLADRDAAPV